MHTFEEIESASKTGDNPNQDITEKIFKGNCITVSNNGSIGFAFYQESDFTCSHDVNPLYLKGYTLNKNIAIFLCTLIELDRYRWAYGRKWRPKRMPSSQIKLPIDKDGRPDWLWIDEYMQNNIRPILPSKSRGIWNGEYNNKPISSIHISLDNIKWDWFTVSDLFHAFERGKVHSQYSLPSGNEYFYVGAKKDSNGVMTRCGYDENLVSKGNCVIFICNGEGSVGYSNYMDRDFMASGDLILGYGEHINQYTGLFLSTILDKERPKYSFGRKYGKYVKGTKILLPATKDGTPDWEFMENYIKSLPYSANI